MRTARRLSVGLFLALLLVVVVGVVSFASTRRFEAVNRSVMVTNETLHALNRVSISLATAESAVRGYIISGDSTTLAPFAQASRMLTAWNAYRAA